MSVVARKKEDFRLGLGAGAAATTIFHMLVLLLTPGLDQLRVDERVALMLGRSDCNQKPPCSIASMCSCCNSMTDEEESVAVVK